MTPVPSHECGTKHYHNDGCTTSSTNASTPPLLLSQHSAFPANPREHDHRDGEEQYLYVILFYKYHNLSNNRSIMEQYQSILDYLCRKLRLHGRILIGIGSSRSCSSDCQSSTTNTDTTGNDENYRSNNEGINGTLAGQYHDLLSFTHALLYYQMKDVPEAERKQCYSIDSESSRNDKQQQQQPQINIKKKRQEVLEEFWIQSAQFFTSILSSPSSELRMTSPDDFKWSRVPNLTSTIDTTEAACCGIRNDIDDDHDGDSDKNDCLDTTSENCQSGVVSSPSPSPQPSLLFPDLNVKLVSELIGTGCPEFQKISIAETSIGYLTPQEWHEHLTSIYRTPRTNDKPNDAPLTFHNDAIIIDCRNTKEYQIGHFPDAIHPNMTTFAQFVPWVERNRIILQNKKIYMYCTGGIRCEKGSAYIRKAVPNVEQVYHLKGGIHKYLEHYAPSNETMAPSVTGSVIGNSESIATTTTPSLWKGRNFVFDGRGSIMPSSIVNPTMTKGACDDIHDDAIATATATTSTNDVHDYQPSATATTDIIGQCAYCQSPYDQFDPTCVCTVCREPILVCQRCQIVGPTLDHEYVHENSGCKIRPKCTAIQEYHCGNHQHLQNCYYTNLHLFSIEELQCQLQELTRHISAIAIGRRFKQKRKTMQKQMIRIQDRIDELQIAADGAESDTPHQPPQRKSQLLPCRNCGSTDCRDGRCWGFFGLKRKERLETPPDQCQKTINPGSAVSPNDEKTSTTRILPHVPVLPLPLRPTQSGHSKNNKRRNESALDEMVLLNVTAPPSKHRDNSTGIRVPPCCTRIVQCTMKAKWYGQSVLKVIQNEFAELAKADVLNVVVSNGLLRLNGKPISLLELPSIALKGSDTLGRIIHWHEAPVLVPMTIDVERYIVAPIVLDSYGGDSDDTATIFICNKPSSVPTHPAGPYLFNTLTMMVEGQECLPSQSLYPLHRTDRVTSGLTLCSTSVAVSRAFQKSYTSGNVDKMYLAKVDGNFASTFEEVLQLQGNWKYDVGCCEWSDDGQFTIVDAPIYTCDPAAGIRSINHLGKPSKSCFQKLYYDTVSNTSVLLCCPITGRNHQLRVHLQAIGFPIINDIQYGGRRTLEPFQSCDLNAAIDAMIHVRDTTVSQDESRVSSLTIEDVVLAKRACKCCSSSGRDGILASFTKAQLLMEGHSICLHAYRYRVRIVPPKSTKPTEYNAGSPLAEFDFQVRPPIWMDDQYLQNVAWLSTKSAEIQC